MQVFRVPVGTARVYIDFDCEIVLLPYVTEETQIQITFGQGDRLVCGSSRLDIPMKIGNNQSTLIKIDNPFSKTLFSYELSQPIFSYRPKLGIWEIVDILGEGLITMISENSETEERAKNILREYEQKQLA